MARVPLRPAQSQGPALDLDNPRAVFVWTIEAHEALTTLAQLAEDSIRPTKRRKLSRRKARALYAQARATIDALPSVGATTSNIETTDDTPRFETWAE